MNILIPNATGPTNIGDHSMLLILLDLLRPKGEKNLITVHTKNPELYEKKHSYKLSPSIYQYVALDNKNPVVQLYRLGKAFVFIVAIKIKLSYFMQSLKNDQLAILFGDYLESDVIVFTGGGYLRSQTGFKQSLNLLLQVFPFIIAKMCRAKIIVAPNSFGPFAYEWQKKAVASAVNGCDVVSTRESYSYKLMKSFGVKNLYQLNDLALLIKNSKKIRKSKNVVGFTIRNWSKDKAVQDRLESAYVHALTRLSRKAGLTIQPIIQVASPDFPFEDDKEAITRVYNAIKLANVPVAIPIQIKSVTHAIQIYGDLDLLLGMRMHSNIIAATQGVPFVAVSYEYKTEGIAQQLGMEKFCIPFELVNSTNLFNKLEIVNKSKLLLKSKLLKTIKNISTVEQMRWRRYFSTYSL